MHTNEPLHMRRQDTSDIADTGADGMTEEEMRLYREILDAAYPHPKHHIADDVMKTVQRETARKRNQRSLILKWGSLAACIALIAMVGIKTLPSLLSGDKLAFDSAENHSVTYQSTGEEAVTFYSALLDDHVESSDVYGTSQIQDNDLMTASEEAAEEDVTTEIALEAAISPEKEDYAADTAENKKSADVGETTADGLITVSTTSNDIAVPESEEILVCPHEAVFGNSYHVLPEELIREVGEQAYELWAEDVLAEDPCGVNILSFIEQFHVSKSMFAMILQNTDISYFCDYPVDLLYSGDTEQIEAYYRNGGRGEELLADAFEYQLKATLAAKLDTDVYKEWLDQFPANTIRTWSISQFVRDHGLTESEFLQIYEEAVELFAQDHEGYTPHTYNTILLFVPNGPVQQAISLSSSGYPADVMCRVAP